jgi:hypothetical protein
LSDYQEQVLIIQSVPSLKRLSCIGRTGSIWGSLFDLKKICQLKWAKLLLTWLWILKADSTGFDFTLWEEFISSVSLLVGQKAVAQKFSVSLSLFDVCENCDNLID